MVANDIRERIWEEALMTNLRNCHYPRKPGGRIAETLNWYLPNSKND
jgi:hypothetical protein